MDKVPVCFRGKSVGEMIVEQGDCCAWFTVYANLPEEELLCAWVLGDYTELRLGILDPAATGYLIRRKFSERMIRPLGTIRGAEIRTVNTKPHVWKPVLDYDAVFRSSGMKKWFLGQQGLLMKSQGKTLCVAVPYDKEKHFSAIELFCFARLIEIEEREYLAILFDENEQVVFYEKHLGKEGKKL